MKKLCLIILSLLIIPTAQVTYAQEDATASANIPLSTEQRDFSAEILQILSTREEMVFGTKQTAQELEIRILNGSDAGKKQQFTHISSGASGIRTFEEGDKIIVTEIFQPDGTSDYFVRDYIRTDALTLLFGLFVLTVILVAGKKGIAALLGMAYSFFIIFVFVLPQISQGQNPIIIALAGGLFIVPVTFYLSHGVNKKTHAAILGTMLSLAFTAFLSHLAIDWAHLTGFSSEDASFLQVTSQGTINIRGLLLAGIIVGLFGILDDITVSQAAIVHKLKETSPHLSKREIYAKSMDVGKDHIGSLINTLILVYTGAALPFLLLITMGSESLSLTLNYEILAEEIVRTLTASIGLILAVPLTTFIASEVS